MFGRDTSCGNIDIQTRIFCVCVCVDVCVCVGVCVGVCVCVCVREALYCINGCQQALVLMLCVPLSRIELTGYRLSDTHRDKHRHTHTHTQQHTQTHTHAQTFPSVLVNLVELDSSICVSTVIETTAVGCQPPHPHPPPPPPSSSTTTTSILPFPPSLDFSFFLSRSLPIFNVTLHSSFMVSHLTR